MKAGDRYTPQYISSMCQLQVKLLEDLGTGSWKVRWAECSEGRISKSEHETPVKDFQDWRLMDEDELWPITIHNIKPHVKALQEKEKQKFLEYKKREQEQLEQEKP